MLLRWEIAMNIVLRQEHKYQLSYLECRRLRQRFSALLQEDGHNGPEGYLVRSLYFDTPDNRDFYEKQAGVEIRQKMRLRIYHPSDEFAMLEMKQKQGMYQRKRSLRVTREEAESLIRGCYTPLLRYKEPFAGECYAFLCTRLYRPKAIVEYRRIAFVAGGNSTRVTLDHTITATESNFDLFDPALCQYPVCDPVQSTLEVKYRDFLLDNVKCAVSACNKTDTSLSKYAMARMATLGR